MDPPRCMSHFVTLFRFPETGFSVNIRPYKNDVLILGPYGEYFYCMSQIRKVWQRGGLWRLSDGPGVYKPPFRNERSFRDSHLFRFLLHVHVLKASILLFKVIKDHFPIWIIRGYNSYTDDVIFGFACCDTSDTTVTQPCQNCDVSQKCHKNVKKGVWTRLGVCPILSHFFDFLKPDFRLIYAHIKTMSWFWYLVGSIFIGTSHIRKLGQKGGLWRLSDTWGVYKPPSRNERSFRDSHLFRFLFHVHVLKAPVPLFKVVKDNFPIWIIRGYNSYTDDVIFKGVTRVAHLPVSLWHNRVKTVTCHKIAMDTPWCWGIS